MLYINTSISNRIEIFIFLILGSVTLFSAQDSLSPSHLSSDYWIYSGSKEAQLLPCDKKTVKSAVNTPNSPDSNPFWEIPPPLLSVAKTNGNP